MIEKQSIGGRDVWIKIDPHPVERANPNIIPKEYFTASYYFHEPPIDSNNGEMVLGEDGEVQLFESPVAALTGAAKKVEGRV